MKIKPVVSAVSIISRQEKNSLSHIRQELIAILLMISFLISGLAASPAYALQGATGIHDPSTIIKRNGVYHVFGTGDGIYHLTSTDLIRWDVAPPVFAAGTWPSWINTYAPGFQGFFWAPDVYYVKGKYYMYYSGSTFGSQVSAIGLATSSDLTTWTDQGVVVYSNNSTAYNAIDAAVFRDATARVWLVFGSHWAGIYMMQLNTKTGKRRNSTLYHVATHPDAEAAYIIRRGKYYYLFYNIGRCCDGVNSTYEVMMGRSTRPQGPYYDRRGKPLTSGGGTSFLSTSGRYIGPGHIGLFTESVQYLTYHFYDGNANGWPTLRISNLRWDSAGWPYASADWINDGRYKVVNRGNGLVWDGLSGEAFEPVVQSAYSASLSQQWDFTSLGNGAYKIMCAHNSLSVGLAGGATEVGAKLDLYSYFGSLSQQWNIERASDGSYVLSSANGNRVVDVPNGTTATGTQLQIWDYNGFDAQKWQISAP